MNFKKKKIEVRCQLSYVEEIIFPTKSNILQTGLECIGISWDSYGVIKVMMKVHSRMSLDYSLQFHRGTEKHPEIIILFF